MTATYPNLVRARQVRSQRLRQARKEAVKRVRAFETWSEKDARRPELRLPMPELPTDHDYRIARGEA